MKDLTHLKDCHIAVLMTCHNRRDITLACLDSIKSQEGLSNIHLHIYLVDDGCTDGTSTAVLRSCPDATILQGDGNLYWCGGMRLAWAKAMKSNYDYYLWLNDDTHIYKDTIRKLVETQKILTTNSSSSIILAGATCEPFTNECTYSGVNVQGFFNKPAFRKVSPSNETLLCDTFNGNCVLIPNDIALDVGNLSSSFTHGMGDFDYGLRANKHGYQCWLAPGFIGECEGQKDIPAWSNSDLSMNKKIAAAKSTTGLPPVREWMVFTWRHAGWLWPICWFRSIVRLVSPRLWLFLRKNE